MSKFADYFNSTTNRGRANVAKATYAFFAALYVFSRLKKSSKKSLVNSVSDAKREIDATEKEEKVKLDHFNYSRCETEQNEGIAYAKENEGSDLNEETAPAYSQGPSVSQPLYGQESTDAARETMKKSSRPTSESVCRPTRVTNEQKAIDIDSLWW